MTQTILVIDDDQALCALIKKCAEQEYYSVALAYTGADGLKKATENTYPLLILDVMLPEINGFSVLAEIRQISSVPVLMLTAKNDEADKIRGLRLGADDYLTKPFRINELMACIASLSGTTPN